MFNPNSPQNAGPIPALSSRHLLWTHCIWGLHREVVYPLSSAVIPLGRAWGSLYCTLMEMVGAAYRLSGQRAHVACCGYCCLSEHGLSPTCVSAATCPPLVPSSQVLLLQMPLPHHGLHPQLPHSWGLESNSVPNHRSHSLQGMEPASSLISPSAGPALHIHTSVRLATAQGHPPVPSTDLIAPSSFPQVSLHTGSSEVTHALSPPPSPHFYPGPAGPFPWPLSSPSCP